MKVLFLCFTMLMSTLATAEPTSTPIVEIKDLKPEELKKFPLTTDENKTMYTLGQLLARNIVPFELTREELLLVLRGFTAGVLTTKNKPEVELEKFGPKVNEWVSKRVATITEREKKKGTEFFAKLTKEDSAVKKHAKGFYYKIINPGKGAKPKATDRVKVDYHGTLLDGSVFDSSVDRKQPATFGLDRVIPCWQHGVQDLSVGGKMKLFCPSDLAYGDRGSPPSIKGGSTLVFEVTLLEILKEEPKATKPTTTPATPALVQPPK